MIAARSQQHPKDRFDFADGEPQIARAVAPVVEHRAFALCIANANTVRPLVRRHFGDERHAAGHDLQQIAVERVDHRTQHGQWTRRIGVGCQRFARIGVHASVFPADQWFIFQNAMPLAC